MQRELTITLDEQVYEALHRIAERQNVSNVIENLLIPCVLMSELDLFYHSMVSDDRSYRELRKLIENRDIHQIILDLLQAQRLRADLETGYRAMAADQDREAEALEWSEGTVGDAFDETR